MHVDGVPSKLRADRECDVTERAFPVLFQVRCQHRTCFLQLQQNPMKPMFPKHFVQRTSVATFAIQSSKLVSKMRRSVKQDLLLAVCSKMGDVIPLLTDAECDACVKFLKSIHATATQSVESVSSPAFQNLSLRELLTEKAVVAEEQGRKEKKTPKNPKAAAPSPRAPSERKASKRSLWGDGEVDEEVPVKKRSIKGKNGIKKPKVAKKQKKDTKIRDWDAKKHGVIVDVVKYDAGRDALIVDAKLSTHGRSKANRVHVRANDVDKISEEYWPKFVAYISEHEMPASFKATRFGASYAQK